MGKYWEDTKFWNEYPGNKCKYWTFLNRLWKGIERETAIMAFNLRCAGLHDDKWHTCPRCMKYKSLKHFYNSRSEKNGKDNVCSACRLLAHEENFKKEGFREKIYAKRKELYHKNKEVKRVENSEARRLDRLFFDDEQVKRNRAIILKLRKISSEETRQSKIQFLHYNKGFCLKYLKKVYWEFDSSVINYSTSD